ncbi:hypothetical protein EVAR_34147_1 [Eumeta japonica]|uniref:Nucleic-acid-binding protein from transposon X-element n=1 Tax=Eumeta variegata TaxID=151549 RepID=A0A4C1ZZP6_EUMVA|nr:hypothetical protein EVAR_34147_1 [Eumeta japonica]
MCPTAKVEVDMTVLCRFRVYRARVIRYPTVARQRSFPPTGRARPRRHRSPPPAAAAFARVSATSRSRERALSFGAGNCSYCVYSVSAAALVHVRQLGGSCPVLGSEAEDQDHFKVVRSKKCLRKRANRSNRHYQSDSIMELDQLSTNPSNQMDSPASPDPAPVQDKVILGTPVTEKAAPTKTTGAKPVAPPKVKPPPPIYLRDKSKWSTVSVECNRLHIQYTNARNLMDSIKITVSTIQDYRNLTRLLINGKIPFHTHPLDEERKIKAVIKGIPLSFRRMRSKMTSSIKDIPSAPCIDCTEEMEGHSA